MMETVQVTPERPRIQLPNQQLCRNVTVCGRRTSVRMERIMWNALEEICRREDHTINELLTRIDQRKGESGLTAAIRVFITTYYREAAQQAGAIPRSLEEPGRIKQLSTTVRAALSVFEPQADDPRPSARILPKGYLGDTGDDSR